MADQSDPLSRERELLRANAMRKPGEPFMCENGPEPDRAREMCFACPNPSVVYRAFPVGIGRMLEAACARCSALCCMQRASA